MTRMRSLMVTAVGRRGLIRPRERRALDCALNASRERDTSEVDNDCSKMS